MEIRNPGQPEGAGERSPKSEQSWTWKGRLFRSSPLMNAFPPLRVDSIARMTDETARKVIGPADLEESFLALEESTDDLSAAAAARTERVFTPIHDESPVQDTLSRIASALPPDVFTPISGRSSTVYLSPDVHPSTTAYLLPDVVEGEIVSHGIYVEPKDLPPETTPRRSISVLSAKEYEKAQKKIPEKLRHFPEGVKEALVLANKQSPLPTLKARRAEEITLENLTAPIMIGKDKEGKPFVTICYETVEVAGIESTEEVGFDVFYRVKDNEWTNTQQTKSQIFSTTEREQLKAKRHAEVWSSQMEKEVKAAPALLSHADSRKLQERLLALVMGKEVPCLTEVRGSPIFKQPDPAPNPPTVHLYDPKGQKRVTPWKA